MKRCKSFVYTQMLGCLNPQNNGVTEHCVKRQIPFDVFLKNKNYHFIDTLLRIYGFIIRYGFTFMSSPE